MKEFAEKNQGILTLIGLILLVFLMFVVLFKTDEKESGYTSSKVAGFTYRKVKDKTETESQTNQLPKK